ncbi:L-fuculose-phosphate aldolase [Cladophialophora psammophila CBS 110553]|uniref:L-fuculose-phosphate aldolase n=1 Tax=Cladophialophora psammophila CBS 110553 TaxID=1182543 RepID=W9WR42_9EURO|nr:L-fuculose-phosphate aldolase [Cladophialophora psammophila CBS 110553]EXJ70368.1 L-fuculose-phosphate aldolase [Cladophialophora psammophila CBS 110553]
MSTTTEVGTIQDTRNGSNTQPEAPAYNQKSAIEAISQGATIAGIPSFTSMDKKRRWMLEHMAGAFRVFGRKGYAEGMSGHISLRDPEHPDSFWTNPLGLHFSQVKVSDLILLGSNGSAIGGNRSRPANAAGFQIHGAIHRMYPHVNAACHAHSVNGKAWSTFAQPLEMINQDSAMFYGEAQAVYPEFGGVVLDPAESVRLASSLGPNGKLLILRNHGLLTAGQTVDEAAYLFTLAERSCEIQLKTEAAAANGMKKMIIDKEAAEYTFKMTSDPEALYVEFQPDYELERELTDGAFLK